MTAHLWEFDHPYYCEEGNFYKVGQHTDLESWQEFTETAWYDWDRDLNFLFRWDWRSWRRHPDPDLRSDEPDKLLLFFMLQRKAASCSVGIAVTDEDEPAVREWLATCAETMRQTWEPLLGTEDGVR